MAEAYLPMVHVASAAQQEDNTSDSPSSRPKPRRAIWLGIALVGMIVGSLIILVGFRTTTLTTTTEDGGIDSSKLFEASSEEPTSIVNFLSSRRLAQVGAFSFNETCPVGQPICNPEITFAIHVQDGLKAIKKMSPETYRLLHDHNFTLGQQEFLLKVLRLLRDPVLLQQAELVYHTAKNNSKAGDKVVHAKVKAALIEYGKKHGMAGLPAMIASNPETSDSENAPSRLLTWHDDTIKSSVSWHIPTDPKAPDQSKGTTDAIIAGFTVSWILTPAFGITWLTLMILQYTYQINIPLGIRRSMTWLAGVLGSFCLPVPVSCPLVFLAYWLDEFLLFGRSPGKIAQAEMKKTPWDFMMKNLPGLAAEKNRRLLVADARMAA